MSHAQNTNAVSRRDFLSFMTQSVAVLALVKISWAARVLAKPQTSIAVAWLKEVDELARAAKKGEVLPLAWQTQMEALLARIDLNEFVKFIDLVSLSKQSKLPSIGESFEEFSFPQADGLPLKPHFYRNLAGFQKGRSIPPHGHNNLVSSFLVLRGELHGRHFERVRDEGDDVIVRPTIDRGFGPGTFSTVSDARDNIHWFTALSEGSFIFDLGAGGLDPHWVPKGLSAAQQAHWQSDSHHGLASQSGRVYLDVDRKKAMPNGLFRAQRLSHDDAYKMYG